MFHSLRQLLLDPLVLFPGHALQVGGGFDVDCLGPGRQHQPLHPLGQRGVIRIERGRCNDRRSVLLLFVSSGVARSSGPAGDSGALSR